MSRVYLSLPRELYASPILTAAKEEWEKMGFSVFTPSVINGDDWPVFFREIDASDILAALYLPKRGRWGDRAVFTSGVVKEIEYAAANQKIVYVRLPHGWYRLGDPIAG